jgi:ribosomal-protein-alanine N-acetyltransferase
VAELNMQWPVRLTERDLQLRPLRLRDGRRWRALRTRNADWLEPWEATLPANREARAGRAMPFGLAVQEELVGQLSVGAIAFSSLRSCTIGYWIDQAHAGRGLMTRAVALVGDYCFLQLQLHRIEINIRPENAASLAVVRNLGFRKEGLRERYLHIAGQWHDHWSFALTAEERPDGLRAWLRGQGRADGASVAASGD